MKYYNLIINQKQLLNYITAIYKLRAVFFFQKRKHLKNVFPLSITKSTFRKKKTLKSLFKTLPFSSNRVITLPVLKTFQLNIASSNNRPLSALFHIKNVFDVEEFLLYDIYNFYNTISINNVNKGGNRHGHNMEHTLTKINFFYYIKRSIKTFRLHTARILHLKASTEYKLNSFFKNFKSIPVMSYI